jgi:hypothetical protein
MAAKSPFSDYWSYDGWLDGKGSYAGTAREAAKNGFW